MDSGCNLNQNCPAAGLTVQQPNVYNNCKVGQSAPEAVDGCKYLRSLMISWKLRANHAWKGLDELPMGGMQQV
jgi:hypothetical protein